MKSEENIAFGANLAQIRNNLGITQEELAFRCGFDRSYIGTIERGEKSATINTLSKIAKGLNLKIKDLFDYE